MSIFQYCLIILVVSRSGGSESEVEVCEYEDATLLFPNMPASSINDIKAKTWNKDKGIRLASWMTSTNFVPSPLYRERVTAVGENSIKMHNVRRSDTGTYTLVLTSGSTQNFTEFTVYLEVLVPPTVQCIPKITQERNTLKAVLPPDHCGIPNLAPSWMSGVQTINGNISVLSFESGLAPGMYIACAMGKSRRCLHGHADELCSTYTALHQDESGSVSGVGIITVITFYIVTGVFFYLVCLKWESIKRKLFPSTEAMTITNTHDEGTTLLNSAKDSRIVLQNASDENTLMGEETPPTDVPLNINASAGTLDKDAKLQEKLQMQPKQKHKPGSVLEEASTEAMTITNTHDEETTLIRMENSAKELPLSVKASTETLDKDTNLQERLQMHQKQKQNPESVVE